MFIRNPLERNNAFGPPMQGNAANRRHRGWHSGPGSGIIGTMSVKMTPMLRQYLDLKQQAEGALLLYRMGDFYELFFEDAQVAAPVLGITLTKRRHNNEVEAPMCGVPHHAFDNYLGKLLEAGFRVAVAEQVEDPATAKGLVRREIMRIHTPGTVSDADLLEGSEHCYLACIGGDPEHPSLAWLEVSTGIFEGLGCADARSLAEHLARLAPREILVSEGWDGWRSMWPASLPEPTVTPLAASELSPTTGEERLKRVLGVVSLRGFGLAPGESLTGLAGALVGYAETTQRGSLAHLRGFVRRHDGDCLVLDGATLRNLEIVRSSDGSRRGSLLDILDTCQTRMGSRLMGEWLTRPSVEPEIIAARHRVVAELVEEPSLLDDLRLCLKGLPDLERLSARVGLGQVSPRELQGLRAGLDRLPALRTTVDRGSAPLLLELASRIDLLDDVAATLAERLAEEPASQPGQGVIRSGFDPELDEQRQLARGAKELLAGVELAERERTGIGSLKVRYNKVFGYFIEVSKSNLDRVPESYERRQTLTNAERFVTPQLKELESRILAAEERSVARERELYRQLVEDLVAHARRLASTAAAVGEVDVLGSFADRASRRGYCRPVVEAGRGLILEESRHPVLEELQRDPPFVPNDCEIDPEDHNIILLTGPNMGGKSTYLRQVALIVLMAHAGSFVPAAEASIGLTDRIFTRVGASDMLARGESTFMVEMTETANILHHATPRSLVILDEVGRGTATFDGLSLAWAIVEHLHDDPAHAARVLFATHYHELTDLARRLPRLVNRSMAVKEWQGSILFLHRVVEGPSDRSYGIHVARLAGVPETVCRRAEEILAGLEEHELTVVAEEGERRAERVQQLDLFRPGADEVLERLRRLDPNSLTPIEALQVLAELKERAE